MLVLLTKTAKNLLDTLRKETPKRKNGLFVYRELEALSGLNNFDLINALDYLEEKCLIKQARLNGQESIGVSLTHKGTYYEEIKQIAIKEFLFKSVLVPIAISVLTTAIITFIGFLWGQNAISQKIAEPINTTSQGVNP